MMACSCCLMPLSTWLSPLQCLSHASPECLLTFGALPRKAARFTLRCTWTQTSLLRSLPHAPSNTEVVPSFPPQIHTVKLLNHGSLLSLVLLLLKDISVCTYSVREVPSFPEQSHCQHSVPLGPALTTSHCSPEGLKLQN